VRCSLFILSCIRLLFLLTVDPHLLALIAEHNGAAAAASFFVHMMTFAVGVFHCIPHVRNPSIVEQRLIWSDCEKRNTRRGAFRRAVRMEKHSFDKLVESIRSDLVVDKTMAKSRGGPIVPELCVFCAIRHVAGGSRLDTIDICGTSVPSFCRVLWRTARAINRCPDLDLKWPKEDSDVFAAAAALVTVGTNSTVNNCVGVVDGCLLRISTPRKSEAKNVRSFFSGHCECHGANVQAAADHHSRFAHVAMAAPGATGDRDAVKAASLCNLIEGLPCGRCVTGDPACDASEHVVPVCDGADRLNAKHDDFDFCASQLRIRIEMAFGMMQNKWATPQRPVTCRLKNVSLVVQVTGRLHDCCIAERIAEHGNDAETAAMERMCLACRQSHVMETATRLFLVTMCIDLQRTLFCVNAWPTESTKGDLSIPKPMRQTGDC